MYIPEPEMFLNTENTLKELGIKIHRPIIGGYRSLNNILKQISKKWNDFSPKQKEDIACNLAGNQNKNDFKNLMDDFNV